VIILTINSTYKLTGLIVLFLGALFFLRDLGVNYIGKTSGWTILIVLLGAGILAGDFRFSNLSKIGKGKKR